MAGTRSSTRIAGQQQSSPSQPKTSPSASPATGSKRKSEAGSSPSAKRGRKATDKKEQKTIEETMEIDQPSTTKDDTAQNGKESNTHDNNEPDTKETEKQRQNGKESTGTEDNSTVRSLANGSTSDENVESKTAADNGNARAKDDNEPETENNQKDKDADKSETTGTSRIDNTSEIKPQKPSESEPRKKDEEHAEGDSAVQAHARDDETPSSILEKGVIYFFFRGRVGIDSPSEVSDIARSYMILRPIPHGAKIGEGTIGDGDGKCRLLALPKKVLPLSGKDRFMTFVEKSNKTFKELKEEFMKGSDYTTQTAGVRHTPAVTPVAEGVYALTTTGRESHLVYMITIPNELGEVQNDMGIREQGSFVTSAKNPQYAGPANTNLPESPDFPKEILDEFRSLRWAPLQPKFLDYENTQFLLIGESSGLDKIAEQQPAEENGDKLDPKEELEKLEGEDEIRVKNLNGEDAVFADLGISKKDYSGVPSTWSD